MPQRQDAIAGSVCYAILYSDRRLGFLKRLPAYFYIYYLTFECLREDLFGILKEQWGIDVEKYRTSFSGDGALQPLGDMGYSGSTFFRTRDSAFLVKSVPRHFEHSFFKDELMVPYAEYMRENPGSLLAHITDFLECVQHSVGTAFGSAPSHHIVMENILHGQDGNQDRDQEQESKDELKWESYDLKPMSYFYPERDIANGALASEATKSKLADEFNDKLALTRDQAEEFIAQLEKDTQLLAKCNAVDYSLLLVRISGKNLADMTKLSAEPPSWRTGIKSADGRYVYRAAILDFFWAKHRYHAKAMTGLIKSYNLIDKQGPMSVTTKAPEYRDRFLKMCRDMVEC